PLLEKSPQKGDLHRLFKGSSSHYSTIGIALGVEVNDLLHSPLSASDKLILVFERWIESDNDVTWRNILEVCEDYPKELGKTKSDVEGFLSSDRARRKY
uniref:Death domain-containing protein n=1 Tax=Amphimedon queenslandica TaxID=400682 RepID=A0A1X7T7A4_AMPQE